MRLRLTRNKTRRNKWNNQHFEHTHEQFSRESNKGLRSGTNIRMGEFHGNSNHQTQHDSWNSQGELNIIRFPEPVAALKGKGKAMKEHSVICLSRLSHFNTGLARKKLTLFRGIFTFGIFGVFSFRNLLCLSGACSSLITTCPLVIFLKELNFGSEEWVWYHD